MKGRKEDLHVVAVHMHGVAAEGKVIVHNQANSLVRPKVHDVILFGEVKVAEFGFQKHRVVVVASETDIVDKPEIEVGLIGAILDYQVFSSRRVGVGCDGKEGLGDGEVIVVAVG